MLKVRGSKMTVNNPSEKVAYSPVPEGYYLASVRSVEMGTFEGGFKGSNQKFTYLKMTPDFVLLNELKTQINRQDIVLGPVDADGYIFRPDGDETKPALFNAAAFLLGAMGFVDENNEIAIEFFHPDLVCGQVIRVLVKQEKYVSSTGEEKTKNVIKGFYPVSDKDAQQHGFYRLSSMTFLNEEEANRFVDIYNEIMSQL